MGASTGVMLPLQELLASSRLGISQLLSTFPFFRQMVQRKVRVVGLLTRSDYAPQHRMVPSGIMAQVW
eukprot:3566602-Amphidinium_carterae.2